MLANPEPDPEPEPGDELVSPPPVHQVLSWDLELIRRSGEWLSTDFSAAFRRILIPTSQNQADTRAPLVLFLDEID